MSSTTLQDTSRLDPGVRLVGQTIDKYRIVRLIGRGGMGRVYEAVNTTIKKRVAMKLIDHELSQNEEANARFQREALAASAVESPYIVQIFDAGRTDEGVPYIVMELLRGRDLRSLLREHQRLAIDQTLLLTAQVLKGLHHAHTAGIVHRDLKPDNVFLVERDDEPVRIKLLDFGVSKIARSTDSPLKTLTRQGTVVGTPYYMSPEQAQAFPDVDGRTDLYSLGAIVYECLAGRPPVEGQTYEQVIVNICVKDVQDVRSLNPDVPAGIAAVIHKALSREREDRFQDARAMLDAIAESAPENLRSSTPSAELRISAKPGSSLRPAPGRVVATPPTVQRAGELADTVEARSVSDESGNLVQSGITRSGSTRAVPEPPAAVKEAASLVLDEGDEPVATPTTRRRWALAVAPGVAVLLAIALVLRFGGGEAEQDATLQPPEPAGEVEAAAPPQEPADEKVQERPEPTTTATAHADAKPTSSAPPVAGRPPALPAREKVKGSHAKPVATSAPPKAPPSASAPPPEPKNEGLELLPR